MVLGGCSSDVTQESRLTTPGATAQKKNEVHKAQTSSGLPSQGTYPSPQEMSARVNQKQAQLSPTKVAFLAPLSGKSAALGQAMVNAAQLALFDIGGDGFELMPRDTAGTPEGARTAARDAIGSGAQLIIGPIFAAEVAAIKPEVEKAGVNTLALSTDVSLAQPGVYVMGFAPVPQVERVVSFAFKQGARRFAALVPAGPYGKLVAEAMRQSVQKEGGELVLMGSSADVGKVVTQKEQIDALLLPFGGAELRKLAGQLTAAGVEPGRIKILGTGLWDEPNLAQGQPLLIGGLFAAVEPEARQRFETSYKETYSKDPPRLATLAYDATALAAVLVRNAIPIDHSSLTNPSGFAGLDGVFRLNESGQIERGLAISEVTGTGSQIINPSPTSFVR